jgi:hypothetical protein
MSQAVIPSEARSQIVPLDTEPDAPDQSAATAEYVFRIVLTSSSSVFSAKKSSCLSQPEASTGYAVCWLAVPATGGHGINQPKKY